MADEVVIMGKAIVARIEELQVECAEIRKQISDAGELQLLDKADDKCKMCLHVLGKGQSSVTKEMLIKMAQQYSQAILDATYVVECRLVNEDFPQDRSAKEIKFLIGRLNLPEQLAKEMFGSESKENKPAEVLGTDVLECLYWRRGALFYMYCHTVFNDHDRRQLNAVHLIECVVSGASYLESMLSVRAPLVLDDHAKIKDTDMIHLLTEGVFSDTHLLALMYAGEMCYWHWKLVNDRNTDLSSVQSTERNFNSLTNGTKFLQRFVDVVRTRFQGKGWDCSRAEELLDEFHAS